MCQATWKSLFVVKHILIIWVSENVSATDNECYNYTDNWSFTAHWLKVTTETSPFVKSDNSEELIG